MLMPWLTLAGALMLLAAASAYVAVDRWRDDLGRMRVATERELDQVEALVADSPARGGNLMPRLQAWAAHQPDVAAVRVADGDDRLLGAYQRDAAAAHGLSFDRRIRNGASPGTRVTLIKDVASVDLRRIQLIGRLTGIDAIAAAFLVALTAWLLRVRRAADLLRDNDTRLLLAVRVSEIGIFEHDHRTGTVYWSPEMRKLFGAGPNEPASVAKYVESVHPDDRGPMNLAVERAHNPAGTGVFDVAHRVIRPGGEIRWLSTRSQTLFDGDGAARRSVRTLGAVVDITERKRVEEALRASEARLAEAQRMGRMGSWDFDLAANRILWSAEALRILEVDPAIFAATPEAFLEVVHPEDREQVRQSFARGSAPKQHGQEMTHRLLLADGRVKHVTERWEAYDGPDGAAQRSAGTIQDVTERVNAEQATRDLNAQLEARVAKRTADLSEALELNQCMLEASSLGIAAYRETGECILANEAMALVPGGTREQVLAQNFRRIPSWQRYGLLAAALRALDTGETQANEFQMTTSFGKRAWFQIYFSRFMRGGEPHLLMTVDDITTRKTAEAALTAANRELETFTYSVSHDLKGPLRGIVGYSRLLLQDHSERLDAEGRQFLDNVAQAAVHMDRLIDDLLAYSRLERREKHSGAVELRALIRSLLAERADEVLSRGARVSVDVPEDAVLRGDREGLAMALRNLLENALKFARPGIPPEIHVEACDTGATWQIAVRDEGIGFDMRFHDRIFTIFQRLHRPEEYPGTGVGLAIVRKAMDRMGGRVWAKSAPGQGATFYLEVPK
jgi:PAS domain S-box-containing protein